MRSTLPLFLAAFAASVPALASEAVPVSGFRSVELRGGGSVAIVPGRAQRVSIIEGSSAITHIYVERDGKLRIDICHGQCPERYRLRVEIQSPRVPDLAIDGGGDMTVAGGFAPQSQLSAAVNGGGTIDARALAASDISAAVNGGGDITVRPRTLSAAVRGGGEIRYLGKPQVSMAVAGGGDVRRID